MWRYVKAAFRERPDLPALGRVPVNLLALAGAAVLSLGLLTVSRSAFVGAWLGMAALEMAYLFIRASSEDFQHLVDVSLGLKEEVDPEAEAIERKRRRLEEQLPRGERTRLEALQGHCRKALELLEAGAAQDFVVESTREALDKLGWAYLKLLIAKGELATLAMSVTEQGLTDQIAGLDAETASDDLPYATREAKRQTKEVLEKRLRNLRRREAALEEIDSNLLRIESQVDLAVENAAMDRGESSISTDLTIAEVMLDDDIFGESEQDVSDIERALTSRERAPEDAADSEPRPERGRSRE